MESTPQQLKQQFSAYELRSDLKEANNSIANCVEELNEALERIQKSHEAACHYMKEEDKMLQIKEQVKKALDTTYDLMSQLELSDENEGIVGVLTQEVFNPLSEAYHTMEGDWPHPVPKTYYRLKKEEIIDPEVVLDQEFEDPELQALDQEFERSMNEQVEEEELEEEEQPEEEQEEEEQEEEEQEEEEQEEEEQEEEEQPEKSLDEEIPKQRKLPFSCLIKKTKKGTDKRFYLRYRRRYDMVLDTLKRIRKIHPSLKWLKNEALITKEHRTRQALAKDVYRFHQIIKDVDEDVFNSNLKALIKKLKGEVNNLEAVANEAIKALN